MDGILLLDKPAGLSSHDVVARVRRALGTREAGHGGTLDPNATGLLVVAVGAATRWLPYLPGDKRYAATVRFGLETDSEDVWGRVLRQADVTGLEPSAVEACLKGLEALKEQVPPMVSALKREGRPLYELARQGVEVERAARPVQIHSLTVTALRLPEADFEVHCGAGTYVRSLCAEAGRRLGVGGCMSALRRRASGGLGVEEALGQAQWTKEALLASLRGPEQVLGHLKAMALDESQAQGVSHGRSVDLGPDPAPEGSVLRLLAPGGRLAALAVSRLVDGRWQAHPQRVFAAR